MAHFERSGRSAFRLTDSAFLRMCEVVTSAMEDGPGGKTLDHAFEVRLESGASLHVASAEEVVALENDGPGLVRSIEATVSARWPGAPISFTKIVFGDNSRPVNYSIVVEGDVRDRVIVLGTELEDRVDAVRPSRSSLSGDAMAALATIPILMMATLVMYFQNRATNSLAGALTKAANAAAGQGIELSAIDVAILREELRPSQPAWPALTLVTLGFLAVASVLLRVRLTRFLWIDFAFDFGSRSTRLAKLDGRRRNLFWGVGISLLVSVCAGFIVTFLV